MYSVRNCSSMSDAFKHNPSVQNEYGNDLPGNVSQLHWMISRHSRMLLIRLLSSSNCYILIFLLRYAMDAFSTNTCNAAVDTGNS